MILFIALFFLFVFYCGIIFFYRQSWLAIPIIDVPSANEKGSLKISILVAARNEAANIKACLDSLICQQYNKEYYEIIVIDDFSTDDTALIVQSYVGKNIRLLQLKDFLRTHNINSYKKKAIEIGVQHAFGEVIVTTDADCVAPANWLWTLAGFYRKNKAVFVAMPVKYQCKNNFLEIFQALDFITLQGITGAAVHKKFHSMCNGANLAYCKTAFDSVNGFEGIDALASGDDMLLMHKIVKQYPGQVFFLKNKAVIVSTKPMPTVKSFLNQRIRWASKADKYDDRRITAVLAGVYLFNLSVFLLPLVAIFYDVEYSLFSFHYSLLSLWGFLILGKTIVELLFLYPVAQFFNQQKLLWWFPVAQPFHILYTLIAGWLGKFGSYKWKERSVK